jgi:hypothetical protein
LITGFVKSRIVSTEPPQRNRFISGNVTVKSGGVLLLFLGVNLVIDGRALIDDQMFF